MQNPDPSTALVPPRGTRSAQDDNSEESTARSFVPQGGTQDDNLKVLCVLGVLCGFDFAQGGCVAAGETPALRLLRGRVARIHTV